MQKYVHTNISIPSHSTHRLFHNLTQSSNPKWGSGAKSRWTDASSGTNHHQMWATTAQSAFSQQRLGPSTKESLWGKMQRCQRNGVLRIQGPKFPKSLKKEAPAPDREPGLVSKSMLFGNWWPQQISPKQLAVQNHWRIFEGEVHFGRTMKVPKVTL